MNQLTNKEYKCKLEQQGYDLQPDIPDFEQTGPVLSSECEYKDAIAELERCGLIPHGHPVKNWSHIIALKNIMELSETDDRVLDAGGEVYSPLVDWLYLYGYRDLVVLNKEFDGEFNHGPVTYMPGDITATEFGDSTFEAIACLSVIEHGVDTDEFLDEAYRLLRRGGVLVVSIDYWPEGVDSKGKTAFGLPWEPFDRADAVEFVNKAISIGFEISETPNLTAGDKIVKWQGEEYTFAIFILRHL